MRRVTMISTNGNLKDQHKRVHNDNKKSMLSLFRLMLQNGYNGGDVTISHWENPVNAYLLKDCIRAVFPASIVNIFIDDSLPGDVSMTDMLVTY